MSTRVEPAPVLRMCSCLTRREELLPEVENALAGAFGEVALKSEGFDFDTSDYYGPEMGEGLRRTWYGFRELCGADTLAETRVRTGEIEDRFAIAGRRQVNLDPGYLDLGKLVLASLKEAPDKIYVGDGVWAHTCLRFRDGRFTGPDHSFPDFKDGRFNQLMLEARELYKSLLAYNRPDRS
jgi:hypothetical protein